MDWLNEEINKQEQELNAREAVVAQAPAVYAELWSEIMKVVSAPAARRFNLKTNGGPRNRKVIAEDTELTLELSPDSSAINAFSPKGGIFSVELRTGSGDIVHLTHDGKSVDYAEAAKRIMKPFLFPDGKS